MNDFDVYKLYISLKSHFNGKYDYFKYNGKNRLNYSSYQKRKDKIFFQKLAKHEDIHNFLLANLVEDSNIWIRELSYSEQAESIYKEWSKRQQSLTYNFEKELRNLNESLNENIIVKDNEHPILLRKYINKEISIDTLCILLDILDAKKYWNKNLYYDPIWEDLKLKVEKYTPFIKYDKDKYKNICLDYFTQ